MCSDSRFDAIEACFADWHYDHPKVLYGLMRSLRPRFVVEVGTYRGYAACYMASALQDNGAGHLWCIDDWSLREHVWRYGEPRDHWEATLRSIGVRGAVTLLEGRSDAVQWPERVDFAYIDGWHSHRACMVDFCRAAQHGAQCICLDDTVGTLGPRLVVEQIRGTGAWDVLEIQRDNGLAICSLRQPKPRPTFSQELRDCAGTDLSQATEAEYLAHLAQVREETGIDYRAVLK
jgi:hypothetical protein